MNYTYYKNLDAVGDELKDVGRNDITVKQHTYSEKALKSM